MADNPIAILHRLRASSGPKETIGLSDDVIEDFCNTDPELIQAIHEAGQVHHTLLEEFGQDIMALPEAERKAREQKGMAAWGAWVEKHGASIIAMGGPLGKTKKVTERGIEDVSNEEHEITINARTIEGGEDWE